MSSQGGSAQPLAAPPVKPGYTTTEFWLSFAPAIFAVLTILHPGFQPTTYQPLANALATIAAAVASGWYASSRSRVKSSGSRGHGRNCGSAEGPVEQQQ